MSSQPYQGAISGVRSPAPVLGARRGAIGPRISPRYADNGTGSPVGPPPTPDSSLITARYQEEQLALGHQAVFAIRHIWNNEIEPEPFAAMWPKFYPTLKRVVLAHYRASAASAAKFYGVASYVDHGGLPRVVATDPNIGKLDHVSDSVANGTFFHQLNKMKQSPEQASESARNNISGAGARFAMGGGRDTIIRASLSDPEAIGWERLTDPGACAYCTQNAARGPFTGNQTDFHPHDYCGCVAVPLFKGRNPVNADLKTRWQQVTQGKTGKQARVAWEQHTGGSNVQSDVATS
jgi:hypothetical protein